MRKRRLEKIIPSILQKRTVVILMKKEWKG